MIVLHVCAGMEAARSLTSVKLLSGKFPGEHDLTMVVHYEQDGQPAERWMALGDLWRYDASEACVAALGEFGTVEIVDAPA